MKDLQKFIFVHKKEYRRVRLKRTKWSIRRKKKHQHYYMIGTSKPIHPHTYTQTSPHKKLIIIIQRKFEQFVFHIFFFLFRSINLVITFTIEKFRRATQTIEENKRWMKIKLVERWVVGRRVEKKRVRVNTYIRMQPMLKVKAELIKIKIKNTDKI